MQTMINNPQRGRCSRCNRFSVRLLAAPLVSFERKPEMDYCEGQVIWFKSDPYEIVEVCDDHVICLAPEAERGESYCYRCWDGFLWPSIRSMVINMPDEIEYDPLYPWATPKWKSKGQELLQPTLKGK